VGTAILKASCSGASGRVSPGSAGLYEGCRTGELNAHGAQSGPDSLSVQPFSVGINDPLGGTPPGVDFNPVAMTLFSKWASLKDDGRNSARAAVARGEALFNTFPIPISGVSGLNDLPGVPASFVGSCTTCHNTPNVGNHSVPLAINIGVTEYPPVPALDITGLPVYTIHCDAGAQTPITMARRSRPQIRAGR